MKKSQVTASESRVTIRLSVHQTLPAGVMTSCIWVKGLT